MSHHDEIYVPPVRDQLRKVPWKTIYLVALLLYLASGIYTVGPSEVGIIRTFGVHTATTEPGLRYRLPYPFQTVVTPSVTEIHRVEIGFRTIPGTTDQYVEVPREALMLTGDENIVHAEVIVQYRIVEPEKYLFRIRNPEQTVRAATEASLRQVIGRRPIEHALTDQRFEIQEETHELLQGILDSYESGLRVVAVQLQDVQPPQPVRAAFRDVVSAREDRERFINEAEGYANDIIPQARGEAARLITEAEAFRDARVARAEGDVALFLRLMAEYQAAPEITRRRLYLEALDQILTDMPKTIVDPNVGALPLLNLENAGGGAQ